MPQAGSLLAAPAAAAGLWGAPASFFSEFPEPEGPVFVFLLML